MLLEPRESDADFFATNPLAFWKRADGGAARLRVRAHDDRAELRAARERVRALRPRSSTATPRGRRADARARRAGLGRGARSRRRGARARAGGAAPGRILSGRHRLVTAGWINLHDPANFPADTRPGAARSASLPSSPIPQSEPPRRLPRSARRCPARVDSLDVHPDRPPSLHPRRPARRGREPRRVPRATDAGSGAARGSAQRLAELRRAIVAPLDLAAGGTWLGVNARGLFAAITNRRCERAGPVAPLAGLLVLDALAEPSARRAAERLASLPRGVLQPVQPLRRRRGARPRRHLRRRGPSGIDLEPGPHVIGNADPDEPLAEAARACAARSRRCARCGRGPAARSARRSSAARTTATASPLDATCVHAGGYGTRSSTLLRLGDGCRALHYADGAPCANPYRDLTPLLRDLGICPSREGARA